ncbi:potassium channel family protein [Pleionea sediminis]|uniref:potassium channel family protein n=1 Tax=Pleionea sediminis TaxID=2569479 RepID=UPI0013DDB5D1|nr:NAD-binding protein [Pleionea sediminis]
MTLSIAIFGCGESGLEVARALSRDGHEVVLFDHCFERVEKATVKGFNAKLASYEKDEDLRLAGVGSTVNLLFALLNQDSENVFLCLSARAIDSSLRIMAISEYPDAQDRLLAAGANKVIDPYLLSANKVVQMMTQPLVSEMLEHTLLGQQDLELAELIVPKNSPVIGKKVSELGLSKKFNLVLIGLLDWEVSNQLIFISDENEHYLDDGDVLIVVGHDEQINALRNALVAYK